MTNQLAENLIDALREVSNLDLAHQLLANDLTDRVAPWLSTWMVELLNAERSARDAMNDGGETDYKMLDLSKLPLSDLQAGHGAAFGSLKAAYGFDNETTVQFIFRVVELFLAELHAKLAEAVHLGLLQTEGQNNG